jgi:hypothetical protein
LTAIMRARFLAVVAILTLAVAGWAVAPAGADEAIVSQDGWWNRLQGPQSNEPANPLRPAIGPLISAPNTVPANAIAVGAQGGEPDKVAAVGLVLDAPEGALADKLILRLKEAPGNGANVNAGSAKISACPITSFWAGAKNGNFADRPTCDDSQAVAGVREPEGTWTFDLTLIAMSWLDPTSDLQQNGVLLVESVDAPQSFQISFLDSASGGITTELATIGGGFSGSGDFELSDEPVFGDDSSFGDTATMTFDDGGSFSSTALPTTTTPTTARAAGQDGQVASPVLRAQPVGKTKLFGNLPLATLLLVPLALAIAAALAFLLGPAGQPAATRRREGGVSRALAAQRSSRTK